MTYLRFPSIIFCKFLISRFHLVVFDPPPPRTNNISWRDQCVTHISKLFSQVLSYFFFGSRYLFSILSLDNIILCYSFSPGFLASYTKSLHVLEANKHSQLVKKFNVVYGTGRFIAVFTTTQALSSAKWIQYTCIISNSLKSVVILSAYLRLGLWNGLFFSCIHTEIFYTFLSSVCAMHVPCISLFWTPLP